jgi:hypothetical protein
VAVVEGERAVLPADRGAHVVDDGVRHVEAAVAPQAHPEREVHVLEVAEEALVEAAGVEERVPPVQRGGRAWREDLLGP